MRKWGKIMNYLKDILNYYCKNFIYVVIFCVAPAIFIGALLKPFSLFQFVVEYPNYTLMNFGQFYTAVYGVGWLDVLWIILGLVLLVVSMSLFLGFIERHFKTGKLSVVNGFSLNSNVLSVLKVVVILAVVAYIINLVMMLLMFFVHFLCAKNGVGNVFSAIFNYIVLILGMFVIMRAFTLFIQTCIGMMINGSPLNVSFSDATHAISRNVWQILLVEAVLCVTVFAIIAICTLLKIVWLGNILGLLIFLPMECILGMIVFCEFNDIKRYDKRRLFVKF